MRKMLLIFDGMAVIPRPEVRAPSRCSGMPGECEDSTGARFAHALPSLVEWRLNVLEVYVRK